MKSRYVFHIALLAVSSVVIFNARGADLYWGQSAYSSGTTYSTVWSNAASWFTDSAGTNVSPAGPGAGDNVHFNASSINTAGGTVSVTTTLNEMSSLNFNTTGATTLSQGASARNLVLGAGGINVASGSGAVTLGTSSSVLRVQIKADQTWTNNAATTLNVRTGVASEYAAGDVALTFNAASSGTISTSLAFGDSNYTGSTDTDNKLRIIVDSSGTGSVTFAGGTYSGGTEIRRGLMVANGLLGTGEVKLGHTGGSASPILRINATTVQTATLNVQAGNTGSNVLQFVTSTTGTWDGDVKLDNNLNIQVRGGNTTTINGDVDGTGSLTKNTYAALAGTGGTLVMTGALTYTGDTVINAGIFELAEAAAMTFFVNENGDSNQIDGTATVNLNGTFIFNLTNANRTDGNSWEIVDVEGLTEIYGGTFNVSGFTGNDGVWTHDGFTFTQSTGLLTYTIPEPSAMVLLGGGLVAFGFRRRRVA